MNKIILLIFTILLMSGICYATDFGLPTDKVMHFEGGYLLTDISETIFKANSKQSFFIVLGIGISKELLDQSLGSKFDSNDIGASLLGWGMYKFIHYEWEF